MTLGLMGKKSRAKHRARELAAEKKPAKADDYFQKGPFDIARFGKVVLMRNSMNQEQHKAYLKALAGRLPQVKAEIDAEVTAIIRIVENYSPLPLLQRGYWVNATPYLLRDDKDGDNSNFAGALRMIDYVQSVIAAVKPPTSARPDVDDAAWAELSLHVETLFNKINIDYVQARTADWEINGGGLPREQQEYYVRALLMWCNVTGHRYHHQEVGYLRELLSPHSAVFQRLWGINSDSLVNGLDKILHALSRGLGEAMTSIIKSYEEYTAVAKEGGDDVATRLEEKMESLKNNPATLGISDNLFGLGLFRIDQFLPTSLLKDLSWGLGESEGFIDGQEHSGWPTRIWPRTLRPFLSVDGSYYCFEVHTLFDNIYRVLQRATLGREPAYRSDWNRAQKYVSEAYPLKLLQKLCPGAKTYQSVFYQNRELDGHGNRKWCELDGLVCFEDHLFIVEVKAGAFSAAPPETDFDVYIRSIKQLIFDPAKQGERFLKWLDDEGKIDLFDEQHQKIGELARGDFAHVTVSAISLDPFTELSAKSHHLLPLVQGGTTTPFWACSISDLITYTELCDNPLVFLHFIEKRAQATRSIKVVMDDELDHYGMYLLHNNYDLHAERVGGDGRISWTGYRTRFDKYFDDREHGLKPAVPRQEMPDLFYAIIQALAESSHPKRRKAACTLLDCDGDMRTNIATSLTQSLRQQSELGRPKPLTISTSGARITFYAWQTGILERSGSDAADHCKACMLLAHEPDRMLLELFFAPDGKIFRAEPSFFTATDVSPAERATLEADAERLKVQRFARVLSSQKKVGPNEKCPCGSGKKFKRCCGS